MLTVIVEAGNSSDRLPALLGCLTSAAVDGLVREVLIAGGGEAIIPGVGGFLRRAPFGVLAKQSRVLAHPDLKRLRRDLGGRAARLA